MAYNKETKKYEGYIYIISNDIDPKQLYIGQTITTLEVRWRGHVWQISNHTYTDRLHNKMKSYGVQHFGMDIIETHSCDSKQSLIQRLDEREIYYISLFDSYNNGLNMTKGGRCGVDHMKRPVVQYSLDGKIIAEYDSVDELHEIFDCTSGIYGCCCGKNKYAYGFIWRYAEDDLDAYPLPSEFEKNQAITRCKSLSPIDKYDYRGNKVCTYKNIADAAMSEEVGYRDIYNCCIGKYIYANMHIFRFCTDNFNTHKTYREKLKLVEQYDLNGGFICVYESVREAGRQTGIPASAISSVCRGEHKTTHGFIWRYVEKEFIMPDFEHNGHCISFYQYDKSGRLLNIFNSLKEATITTGISNNTIISIAKGRKNAISTPFVWSYTPLTVDEVLLKCVNKNNKKVYQYDLNGYFIHTFDSVKEAGLSIGNGNQHIMISACCRGVKKSAYGFIWSYKPL